FRVALEKVDAAQEVVGVGIAGMKFEGALQPFGRFRVTLLFERHAGKLDGEPSVARLQPIAGEQSLRSAVPESKPGQSHAVVVIQFSGGGGNTFRQAHYFLPLLLGKELLDGSGLSAGLVTRLPAAGQSYATQQEKRSGKTNQRPPCWGTASRVQLAVAFHSASNFERSCLSSLRAAGSLTITSAWSESSPVTTT